MFGRLFGLFVVAVVLVFGIGAVGEGRRCKMVVGARQGQSGTDWSVPGIVNFVPASGGDLVQVGSFVWTGPGVANGRFFVAYPVSYGGGNGPVVFVQSVGPVPVLTVVSPTFAGFWVDWWSLSGEVGSVTVFWWAAGRDGGCP